MASLSEVRICNRALSLLGSKRITSLTENSVNARECNAIYDETLEDILCEHPWSFAQKRVALATVDETPAFTDDNMTVVYQKPSDMLKINFVNISSAIFKVEGERILSDTASLKIKYTYRNENPQSYFPKFVTALATLLAANMAYAITNSRTVAEQWLSAYETIRLPKAMSVDSQQGTATMPVQDEWLLSRRAGGSGSIGGNTGQEVWFPVGTA